jgi:hypothetical protein
MTNHRFQDFYTVSKPKTHDTCIILTRTRAKHTHVAFMQNAKAVCLSCATIHPRDGWTVETVYQFCGSSDLEFAPRNWHHRLGWIDASHISDLDTQLQR